MFRAMTEFGYRHAASYLLERLLQRARVQKATNRPSDTADERSSAKPDEDRVFQAVADEYSPEEDGDRHA